MINIPNRKRKRLQRSRFGRSNRLSCTPILISFPMMADYAGLQKASHSFHWKKGAVGFRLVIREDFSMKPSQKISTNLEWGKRGYLPLRGKLGPTNPHLEQRQFMQGTFWVEGSWSKITSAPYSKGQ